MNLVITQELDKKTKKPEPQISGTIIIICSVGMNVNNYNNLNIRLFGKALVVQAYCYTYFSVCMCTPVCD